MVNIMAKLIDYPCKHNAYSGLPIDKFIEAGLEIPASYGNSDTIVEIARVADLHYFPLDPVLEAENMGASIKMDDSPLGPRKADDLITDVTQLADLPELDPSKGRYAETLKAVCRLNEAGHRAYFELRGPFTVLSGLGDIMTVLMGWRKHPDVIESFFNSLINGLCNCAAAAAEAGAGIIYYSDGPGSLQVLGPKYTKKVVEAFTVPFLKELDRRLDKDIVVHLCPKTSFQLAGCDAAEWKKLKLDEALPYDKACEAAKGKVRFIGQRCFKSEDIMVNNINYLELK